MSWRQGFEVPVVALLDFPVDLAGSVTFTVVDGRKLVFEVLPLARSVHELGEEAIGGGALTRLRQALDGAVTDIGILDARDQHVGLDGEVPQV